MKHSDRKQFLHWTIFGGCLIFTLYQSINCVVKYHSSPKGTSVGLIDSNKVADFPAISFCTELGHWAGEKYTAFNADKLKSCNISNG